MLFQVLVDGGDAHLSYTPTRTYRGNSHFSIGEGRLDSLHKFRLAVQGGIDEVGHLQSSHVISRNLEETGKAITISSYT